MPNWCDYNVLANYRPTKRSAKAESIVTMVGP